MNTDSPPPRGLRNILIYVSLGGAFPPLANSAGDVALLRAANLAMRRKAQGVNDIYLFLIAGVTRSTASDEVIKAYGFPAVEIVHLDKGEQQDELLSDYDGLQKDVENFISSWLTRKHPGAIAHPQSRYDSPSFWWIGIEHDDNVFDGPLAGTDFAAELPDTHKGKAETWLRILATAVDRKETAWTALDQERATVAAATLCEWLHGFEAASGNGYNHFDPDSTIRSLGISHFFLGFEAARLSGGELDEFCDEHDMDLEEIGTAALLVITREFRDELRSALASFFGNDGSLYCALHSTIWPKFDRPMDDAFIALLSEGLAEIETPWSFVTDGWCEAANQ